MKISEVRKFLESYRIGLPLALLIFMASCAQVDSIAPDVEVDGEFTKAMTGAAYSDLDVFKGVVFMDGPVAEQLNEFADFSITNLSNNQVQIEELRILHDEVANILLASNENYMAEFRANIGSGDYYLIQSTLASTADEVLNIISELSQQSVESLTAQASEMITSAEEELGLAAQPTPSEVAVKVKVKVEVEAGVEVWLWAVVVVVAVIALVVVIPLAQNGGGNGDYLAEEYFSTVTLQLQGI